MQEHYGQEQIPMMQPLIVALCGDSGTGKNTLTDGMLQVLGPERIRHICLDDYHLYDRATRVRKGISILHPDANNLTLMTSQLQALAQGETIIKPVYDHTTGTFSAPEAVQPAEIIIIHGLHPLFTPALRNLAHVRLYLDPEHALQVQWKILRDSTYRGYTVEEVNRQLAERRKDSIRFIQPQKRFADLIVSFSRGSQYYKTHDPAHLDVRIIEPDHVPHLDLSTALTASGHEQPPALRLFTEEYNNQTCRVLEIDASLNHQRACTVEDSIWAQMAELVRLRPAHLNQLGHFTVGSEPRQSDPLALTQLILLSHVVSARRRLQQGKILQRPQ
jgi:phosphoribulokinase